MVTHMKTTIDIADALLEQAKRRAREQNRTLRDLVEEALRRMLAEDSAKREPFRYRRHVVHGKGLQPGIREGDWEQIRNLIYELPPP